MTLMFIKQGIIFVIDSSDKLRLPVAQNELELLLESKCYSNSALKEKNIPILFFANKMDLPNACSENEIAFELGLHRINDHPWNIL